MVGRTLAAGLATEGHDVRVGGRDPGREDLAAWSAEAAIPVVGVAEAAGSAEVVILATAWSGTENAIGLAGDGLDGKVLIDATNPLSFADGALRLTIGHQDSGGEQVQRWARGARVVKAFNTVGAELMVHPDLPDGPGTMFLAGDDTEAKATARELIAQLGWTSHDCGGIEAARLTEPLAMIWITHAATSGSRSHAFRLLGSRSDG